MAAVRVSVVWLGVRKTLTAEQREQAADTFGAERTFRITKYTVSCEAGDYMSDVKETWEATYQSVDWMYQNRPDAKGPNGLTKGTVRVFAMKSDFSANSPI